MWVCLRLIMATLCAWLALPGAIANARIAYPQSCVLSAETALSARQALAAEAWQCAGSGSPHARHAWLRIPASLLGAERPMLVGDAMAMEGLVVATQSVDGRVAERSYSAKDIASHWTSGTRFALPLPDVESSTRWLLVRVDNPLGSAVITSLEVKSRAAVADLETASLVLLGIVMGMLGLVAIVSAFLAMALRRKFAWFHFAFAVLVMCYVATSGSLIFIVAPDLSLWARSVVSYASIALAVALLSPFLSDFLEPGVLTPRLRLFATVSAWLAVAAAFFLPLGALLGVSLRLPYNLCFIPGIVASVCVAWSGIRKGSAAARAFAMAWCAPLILGAERLVRAFGFYEAPALADFGFYIALAVEAAAMMVAIGWRVNALRRERDEALTDQFRLAEEARSDALTKLKNRRSFDDWRWQEGDYLALLDVDRFKAVNDDFGHDFGDRVLSAVGQVLEHAAAEGIVSEAWRLGGEEFALAIEAPTLEAAALVVNDLRARISRQVGAAVPALDRVVTVSGGLSKVDPEGFASTYRATDRLLYAAKLNGRDRLCYTSGDDGTSGVVTSQLNLSLKSA